MALAGNTGSVLMRRRYRKWRIVFWTYDKLNGYRLLRYNPPKLKTVNEWKYWHIMVYRKENKRERP